MIFDSDEIFQPEYLLLDFLYTQLFIMPQKFSPKL